MVSSLTLHSRWGCDCCDGCVQWIGTAVYEVGREGLLLIDKLTRKTSLCSPQKCAAPSYSAFVNEGTTVPLYSWLNLYYINAAFLILRLDPKVYFFSMLSVQTVFA